LLAKLQEKIDAIAHDLQKELPDVKTTMRRFGWANNVVLGVFDECSKGNEENGTQIAVLHVKDGDTGADAAGQIKQSRDVIHQQAVNIKTAQN
jgi:hypothetical protein